MIEHDYILAVDPDIKKSGVALLNVSKKCVHEYCLSFPKLMDKLQNLKYDKKNVLVVVEAGWMNNSNWHLTSCKSKAMAAKIGNNTGRNHETGHKIVEMALHYGLNVAEYKPLKKCWNGHEGKITKEELEYITGQPSKGNQDVRDAVLLAWCVAGFPIRGKVGLGNK